MSKPLQRAVIILALLHSVLPEAGPDAGAAAEARSCGADGGEGCPISIILKPDDGRHMLTREGSLQVTVQVTGWRYGVMLVRMGSETLADLDEGHPAEPSVPEFYTWEIYGIKSNTQVATSVDFFASRGGERIGGALHKSTIVEFRDAFDDPPDLFVLHPVPLGHPEYPTTAVSGLGVSLVGHVVGEVRPNQWHVLIVSGQLISVFGHSSSFSSVVHFPPEAYRRQCPLIVPISVMTALLTEEGEVITTSDVSLMWAGDLTDDERLHLHPLSPAPDDGTISVLYPCPTHWTQARRPAPLRILADGSLGPPDESRPVRGFMAQEYPEGFRVTDDSGLLGYEPPAPGEFRHLWARAPEGKRVTFVITSCGRMTGLRRTIASFLAANTYPVDRYLVIEDSGDPKMTDKLVEEFGDVFDVVENKRRMGQLFSIDKARSMVQTDYIFHCEDDWVFNGIPGFVEASVAILQHEPMASMVHLCNTSFLYPIDDFEREAPGGYPYHRIANTHIPSPPREMSVRAYAFSFHPGLQRTSDYRQLLMPIQRFFLEDIINNFLFWKGFHMVKLPIAYCNHLDLNRVSRHMEYHIQSYQYADD